MAEACPSCGSTVGPEHDCPGQKLVGTVLDGRYEIDSVLGQGGMGLVFHGFQTSVKRPVAVKTLHASLAMAPTFFERFRREAELASRLHHPNIITIYDFGRTPDGTCYYVMELLEGESLKELVKREGPMSLKRAINVIDQAAHALGYAHKENVVHRDIKPHNIIIQNIHSTDFVKVLDFGLVKALEQDDNDQLTSTGQVLGTPQYMPPEQAGGESVDQRSDLYSLAGVFYFCLTGSSPFGANTVRKALRAAITEKVPPVASRRVGAPVPPEIDEFLVKGLAAEKADRFQSAEELLQELKLAVAGLSTSELEDRPDGGSPPQRDPGSGDHSGPNSRTLAGKARGERTPSGARPTKPETPAVIVDERAIKGRTPTGRGKTHEISAPHAKGSKALAAKAIWGVVGLLVIGLVGYRVQQAMAKPPELPLIVQEPVRPEPPARRVVAVHLRSEPPGAEVLEGASQIGTTPVDLQLAKEKVYVLTFRLKGYEPVQRTLDLSLLTQNDSQVDVALQAVRSPAATNPASARKPKKPADIPVFE